jgi:NADP-dependent 3-hydroxy acid dehydrogenase YdfG
MGYFSGKRAAITGAGSGIGRALAIALNAEGSALWLSDIDPDALERTRALLPNPAAACTLAVVDVADREAVFDWAGQVEAATPHLDLLVNNAGVALEAFAEDTDWADFEWLMGINFWGVVHGCRAFLPLLHRAPRAHLVNLSSLFGLIGVPTQSAYNAAKFAVRGYSEALRLELIDSSVRVLCVHPGGINTNIARAARSAYADSSAEQRAERFRELARTEPEDAARQILRAAEKGKPRLLIGRDARLVALIERLFPARYEKLLPALTERRRGGASP